MRTNVFARYEYPHLNAIKSLISTEARETGYIEGILVPTITKTFAPYYNVSTEYERITDRYTIKIEPTKSKAMMKLATVDYDTDQVFGLLQPLISQMLITLKDTILDYIHTANEDSGMVTTERQAIEEELINLVNNPYSARFLLNITHFSTPFNKGVITVRFA